MKLLQSFSQRSTIAVGLILTFAFSSFLPAQPVTPSANKLIPKTLSAQAAYQQRSAKAAFELQRYKERVERESANLKSNTSLEIPAAVGITIRKELQTASTIFFWDDMESGPGTWTLGGTGLWHQTTRNANYSTHSWWAGIESQGNYSTGARVYEGLVSPPINLTGAAGPVGLLFAENYVTEAGFDFCMVDVSVDGGSNWSHLRRGYGESASGDSYGWIVSHYNLTPYANQTINIRFLFDTGDSLFNTFPGWFVDNVLVFDQSGTISGRVYYDQNQNGIPEANEWGLSNWLVTAAGPITITTQTYGDGAFNILLPLGSYQVSEVLQPLWTQTSAPSSWTVDLTLPDQNESGKDFGDYRLGCVIQGSAFNDLNRDSVYEVGEPPSISQSISLITSSGSTVAGTSTDSLGQFSLLTFSPGEYQLREGLYYPWVPTLPGTTGYTLNVPLIDTVMSGFLFGSYEIPANCTISGTVYYDQNRNGIRETGEGGLSHWVVKATGPITDTTQTDENGLFHMQLPVGLYHLSEVIQPPWIQTSLPTSWTIDLNTPGQIETDKDFGNYEDCTIRGTVYYDQNRNGIREAGEGGLSNWLVIAAGPITDTAQTDGNGMFSMQLPVGLYQVSEVLQPPWTQTSLPASWTVDLNTPGQIETDKDFGDYRLGCMIQGTAFNDLNRDSVYDAGEPPSADQMIRLIPISGNTVGALTDSLGQFTLITFAPGQYYLREFLSTNWFPTLPGDTGYTLNVPPIDTVMSGFLFGSYEVPANCTIRGDVFNDTNRNGIRDSAEGGLAGWQITTTRPRTEDTTAITDSLGNYAITNLIAGPHTVSVYRPPPNWRQSVPRNSYNIILDSAETRDSINFGEYALLPGSISGTVFNDLNANAVRDTNEPTLPYSRLYLDGGHSTVADDSGHYRFDGVWPGWHEVRIAPNSHHLHQTYPLWSQPHYVDLSDEEHRTGIDFGLAYDSTYIIAFRSFLPENIAYAMDSYGNRGKSEKNKPYASRATFDLMAPVGGLKGLHVEFSQTIDAATLTVTHFPAPTHISGFKKWEFSLTGDDTLATNEHVIIFARGNAGKTLYISKYWWEQGGLKPAPGTKKTGKTYGQCRLDFHMPNEINLVETIYKHGFGTKYGLTVGLVPGPHSVYHSKAKDVWSSLFDPEHYHIHVGPPRCIGIDAITLRPFRKTLHRLSPVNGNNILFAEALALKVNIVASDMEITPYGFGNLIFQGDSANRFNGFSVRKISVKLDTALSAFDDNIRHHPGGDTCLCDSNFFKSAYKTIRMIDSAFSGPFDTTSFASGLIVKPVRTVPDVPYLRLDSSFAQQGVNIASRVSNYGEVPWQFTLYQNYPNPFNPTTTISFDLPGEALVSLMVYNTLGQQVAVLLDKEEMDEGGQEVEFNASSLASGVYFYRLVVEGIPDENGISGGSFTALKKMVLLK